MRSAGQQAESLLPGRRGLVLLRARRHDRRVDVDRDQAAISAVRGITGQRSGPLPGGCPRRPDHLQSPRRTRGSYIRRSKTAGWLLRPPCEPLAMFGRHTSVQKLSQIRSWRNRVQAWWGKIAM